jgi:hypothetical protein
MNFDSQTIAFKKAEPRADEPRDKNFRPREKRDQYLSGRK